MAPRLAMVICGALIVLHVLCGCDKKPTPPAPPPPTPTWINDTICSRCSVISVIPTADGGCLLTGGDFDPMMPVWSNVFVARVNGSGSVLWNHPLAEHSRLISAAGGGYLMIVNYVDLVRIDGSGDTAWTRTYDGTRTRRLHAAAQTSDGGFILAGAPDVYLLRIDAGGDSLWTKAFGSEENESAFAVFQTPDHGFLAIGKTRFNAAYLIRTDASGDSLWTQVYDCPSVRSAILEKDGGCVVVGTQTTEQSPWDYDVYMLRIDAAGGFVWGDTLGAFGGAGGYSITLAHDGGYIVTGPTSALNIEDSTLDRNANVLLAKADPSGHLLWQRVFDISQDFYSSAAGACVVPSADGGYIIAAHWRLGPPYHLVLIKTDRYGV